ncbi:putative dna repair protein rad50 protein [Lasiodiplodia theobromae]|uniref:DNA repair protein n=1 Tax=Lasiodiplodia theobromae TaxID=45133 RepID=UPI0015C33DB9|nr:DNA repair protein [Lasiodiplodia theobromae]KAF4539708.1 DNA repair protein [Lasiodiplodia theobromae]KAF9635756.1 putative dna repair protein rad50 protein [Lasiodiplodia theobromae]
MRTRLARVLRGRRHVSASTRRSGALLTATRSYIDKLSILGVRSFDNRVSETIQFYSPLTLIVGFNGSGKTTIIECLKYATTGELPPNSDRGRSFIHDPNLCGEKEVLAQVKMSFKSTSGVKMVSTRSLQMTVKKSGSRFNRTVKALEGQLLMVKDGERTAISSRVAELNQIMPQYLGISSAILEYVIFCHQEDSMWPMSEPSVLKKRFDEIFEALKYTKAIDNIKILQKRYKEELGRLKIIEQHSKEDKDRGERAEQRMNELYNDIDKLRAKTDELEERCKEAADRSREAWDHAAKFQNIVSKLEGKRVEAAATETNVKELQDHIEEMTDTDQELQEHLDKYEERVQLYEQDREEKVKRYNEIAQAIKDNRSSIGAKQTEIGKHEANKATYDRHTKTRETLIKEAANRHGIRGFDLEINDEQVQDFMDRISRLAKEQQGALERARKQKHQELQAANDELRRVNNRKAALETNKNNHKTQIAINERKLSELQEEINKIDVDEGSKATLELSLEDITRRLNKAKEDSVAGKWDEKLRDANGKMRDIDDQKEKLDAEMVDAMRRAGDSAQLDYVRKQLKEKQTSLATNTGVHRQQISKIIGETWEPSTLEANFSKTLHQRSEEVREAELQRNGTTRELEQVQFKLTTAKNELSKKRVELKQCEERVSAELSEGESLEDFPEALATATQSFEVARSDATSFGHMGKFYESCKNTFEEHNMCQLCYRPFRKDDEKAKFRRRLDAKIQEAINQNYQETLQEYQTDLEKLRAAQPFYDTWKRLGKTEIPELETSCRGLESRRDDLLRVIEDQDQRVNERQEAKRDADFLSGDINSIIQDHKAICAFEEEIKELSAKQEQAGASRGVEKIQDDLKEINDRSKNVKVTLAQLTAEKERSREQINRLELESKDISGKVTSAGYALREKNSLLSQVQDLRSQNGSHRESMRQTDQDLQELIPEVEQAQAKYNAIEQRGAQKEEELQSTHQKISDSLRNLRQANEEIVAYLESGGPGLLTKARREFDSLQEAGRQLEDEQRQITAEVKKIDDQLRNHTETKRAINDNLRYRSGLKKLEQVRKEVEELEANNAEVDKDRYEREAGKWQQERNRLSAEQASIVGEIRSKDDQLKQLLDEWDTDYKDAAKNYKEAHIKVETTKAAVEDLSRYGGALDKAVVKYHSLKLEEINRIIEELWKKTYQGTDVDTIMIRSENETTSKQRSYNYRVVMVKQDAELDMRGRCSAGQKVLASIIIRLALAECFGVNCGLIALDEPTTNLDRDNIRALAESLAEIIRVRRQQSNFQLIVITHDEEFLRYMQCADFSDYYYRVSRNEKQKSTIEKQSIAEVL